MREIVHIQVGQCGNQIGTSFWKVVSEEHGIDPKGYFIGNDELQMQKINVHYNEVIYKQKTRYIPRAVMIDLEPETMDSIKSSEYGHLFRPDNFVFGQSGAGNNWAKGFYSDGADLMEDALERIRHEAESCDCIQGFQLCHSLGGGSGAGAGSLLMQKVLEEYPSRVTCAFSVFPSSEVSDVVVEPYNAVLTVHELLNSITATFCLDNEAMYKICVNTLKNTAPTYEDINQLISKAMAGLTCGLRFPGQLNSDLRKLTTNLIPFPRLKFLVPGLAPLVPDSAIEYLSHSVCELIRNLFNPKNMMVDCQPINGRYLTASALLRGQMSMNEVENTLAVYQRKHRHEFIKWIPDNVKVSVCNVPSKGLETSGVFIGNTTAIQMTFRRILVHYDQMLKRKAFLHWYTGEGMDEMEFVNARSDVLDLISDYESIEREMPWGTDIEYTQSSLPTDVLSDFTFQDNEGNC